MEWYFSVTVFISAIQQQRNQQKKFIAEKLLVYTNGNVSFI